MTRIERYLASMEPWKPGMLVVEPWEAGLVIPSKVRLNVRLTTRVLKIIIKYHYL